MYLLTDWKGQMGKYLAWGQDVQTECNKVHASWPRANKKKTLCSNKIVSDCCCGAVRISSGAVCVFPALSPWCVQPSYRNFFLMVFQGNCARGRTGHMIIKCVRYIVHPNRLMNDWLSHSVTCRCVLVTSYWFLKGFVNVMAQRTQLSPGHLLQSC